MKKNYNILLVDDDRLVRQTTRVCLEKMGYALDMAENGKDAVEKWSEKEYDLIVMDVSMPVMNGLEATRTIRSIEKKRKKNKPVTIIAMTSGVTREECIQSGMNEYISKPLHKDQLCRMLSYMEEDQEGYRISE
ncbi:MAG: response regulator [Bacteroidetes bacterium]|nr:response regulator [Bacteroidota bacterium]